MPRRRTRRRRAEASRFGRKIANFPEVSLDILPGSFVRHPDRPDWGLGQVQSVVGDRVTVNFENAGKLLINITHVGLEPVEPPTGSDRS